MVDQSAEAIGDRDISVEAVGLLRLESATLVLIQIRLNAVVEATGSEQLGIPAISSQTSRVSHNSLNHETQPFACLPLKNTYLPLLAPWARECMSPIIFFLHTDSLST